MPPDNTSHTWENPGANPARRVRVLVSAGAAADGAWQDWQAAVAATGANRQIGVSRIPGSGPEGSSNAVAIGYEEELRWFAPVETPTHRRLVLQYAGALLSTGEFPAPPSELHALIWPRPSTPSLAIATEGILLLSHAETDLLALERARSRLPAAFSPVASHSLNAVFSPEDLQRLTGTHLSKRLVIVARIHGRFAGVPGLRELAQKAHAEGWHFVAISGVDDADPELATASTEPAATVATTMAYFMAGGVENVAQALRFLARECFDEPHDFLPPQPMPAHGLYHPELLVTSAEEFAAHRKPDQPLALVIFYRAHVLSGNLAFVDALVRGLEARGFDAVGVFTSSLRETDAHGRPLALTQLVTTPDIIVNTVSYPLLQLSTLEQPPTSAAVSPFEEIGAPVLQAITCGMTRATWEKSARGLSPSETAVNVALPECDGRIIAVPVTFKDQNRYFADEERIARVAGLAARLQTLRRKPNAQKRIAIVLTNASGKAQKVGSAVGLDTHASLWRFLHTLYDEGYKVGDFPPDSDALMAALLARGCYDDKYPLDPAAAQRFSRRDYVAWFHNQPKELTSAMTEAWGMPEEQGPTLAPVRWAAAGKTSRTALLPERHEPHSDDNDFLFAGLALDNVFIGLQPPRGFGVDPEAVYHAPDLAPTHHYAAFYRWLAEAWCADAIIHFGKHGTLEWLPGKSVALSAGCAPDALLGDLPLFYPFVVNDPGEGAQAKRRAHAVIVDHLVPPLTHAETYGPLATLARLVEEYYRAESLDPSKLPLLQNQIWELVRSAHLEDDLRELRRQRHGDHTHEWDERAGESGAPRSLEKLSGRDMAHLMEDLDTYLCDLGRAQIRHGLHFFGQPPTGEALVDMIFAIVRCPNGPIASLGESLIQAMGTIEPDARATKLAEGRDALGRALLRTLAAHDFASDSIATTIENHRDQLCGDTAELERVLSFIAETLVPGLACTTDETKNLILGLNGRFVPAGPSGAPSRGMAHVLPTGRNFYTVDPRGLPSPAAWTVGQALARDALNQFVDETGALPESIALSVWGTTTMRTGGDDIAQALALLGVRPVWHAETRRTIGVEAIPLTALGRARIDVTLRVSGFFRDAFPALMQLVDDAVRLVVALDEPPEQNFVRKHWLEETAKMLGDGIEPEVANRRASFRVFSSKPGAYGTGLLELIENRAWKDKDDLARAFLTWGGWAYGADASEGVAAEDAFRHRLGKAELALHNQDNREHDLFDSDDFFQFHGGLVATISALSGKKPRAYFGDSSNPANPEVRTLQSEALRVYRSRVINPKWLSAIQRHGYKGGLEMAATIDYLFGFSATAGIVTDWMFEGAAENYTQGAAKEFLQRSNPWALHAIAERLLEANQRGLWQAKPSTIDRLKLTFLESESLLETNTSANS